MNRPNKTTVRKKGKGFQINFSKKDGKKLAEHINNGGSLADVIKPQPQSQED